MDFGSLVCRPQNPACENCCLQKKCVALKENTINSLPVKEKKLKHKTRFFTYLVISFEDFIWLNKRTGKDIWQNLYDFPMIETTKPVDLVEVSQAGEWRDIFGKKSYQIIETSEWLKQTLTHQKINARFVQVQISKPLKKSSYSKVGLDLIPIFACPKIVDTYLKSKSFFNTKSNLKNERNK